MKHSYDIAIIGSGFAGSLMSMIALRLGYSVVLIEKGKHPRVVIGESSTPLSNLLLEELATTYNLPMLAPLAKWGSWQKTYPDISCGLKRGFSFFHHDVTSAALDALTVEKQLLVAASPHNWIADTHWFRADVDHFLVEQAKALGVDYFDGYSVSECNMRDGLWTIAGSRDSEPLTIKAQFVIDATGSRGFLYQALGLKESSLPNYPETSSLYCHFTGVDQLADLDALGTDTVPYPVDDAAVHHIFEGGWVWVLHFNNGWTSAGIAATKECARRFNLSDGESAWHRVLEYLPVLRLQFAEAKPVTPFSYLPKLSFCTDEIVGDGWAMLPSAAGFVDPLLSTGFPLTLLGIKRLGNVLAKSKLLRDSGDNLESYASDTKVELFATANLIGALYENMGNFSLFRTISLLYFAAASYSETAVRLGKPELASSFLLATDPAFGPQINELLSRARQPFDDSQQEKLEADIYQLIERYDVAGLCKRPKDHCYPVLAADLYSGAYKLNATFDEVRQLLLRSGFEPSSTESFAAPSS